MSLSVSHLENISDEGSLCLYVVVVVVGVVGVVLVLVLVLVYVVVLVLVLVFVVVVIIILFLYLLLLLLLLLLLIIIIHAKGIQAMKKRPSIAVLLPTTAYILHLEYPPAKKLIKEGVPVALGMFSTIFFFFLLRIRFQPECSLSFDANCYAFGFFLVFMIIVIALVIKNFVLFFVFVLFRFFVFFFSFLFYTGLCQYGPNFETSFGCEYSQWSCQYGSIQGLRLT